MPRTEFTKQVRREAVKRAAGRCEAAGVVYGLEPGQRCNGALGYGFEYDHYPLPATDPYSGDLDNCVVCCKACHGFKTRKYDIPMQAKGKRIQDRHMGTRPPSRNPLPGGRHSKVKRKIGSNVVVDRATGEPVNRR